jgi:metal-responsive CopG/Arc/MetJ family transcriptional regulator
VASFAEKVAVSLDSELLARAERLRKQTGESRSALVARALRALLRASERERLVAEYVEAYRQEPETLAEVAGARRLARRALASVAWDDE